MKTLKSIRLDNDLIERIELLAGKDGRSFSNMVERLLNDVVNEALASPITVKNKTVVTNASYFVTPTVDQVRDYILSKGYTFDAETFIAHYEANGWMRGKNKIKSWKACCTTWAKREEKGNGQGKSAYQQRVEAGDARSFDIDPDF